MSGKRRTFASATGGLVAGFSALCAAELAASAVRPEAGPVAAVGGAVVDRTPAAVKDFAIRTFGTADKLVLQLGILTLLALFAVAVGLLAARHRRTGVLMVLAFGALGAWAALERPDSRPLDALPSVVGGVVACAVLSLLTSKLGPRPSLTAGETIEAPGAGPDSGTGNEGSPSGPARPVQAGSPPEGARPADPYGRGQDTAGSAAARTHTSPGTGHPTDSGSGSGTPEEYDSHEAPGRQDTPELPRNMIPGTTAATRADDEGDVTGSSDEGDVTGSSAENAPAAPGAAGTPGFDRRGFVIAASAVAAASAGAGLLGRQLNSGRQADAAAARSRITIPAPADRARPVPAGAELRVPGLGPLTTPNRDFYRVDTALVVPRVDATRWSLTIRGKGVSRPLTLSYEDLLGRPLIERDITMTCVSNQVGGPYVGNARWIGVRLADLLSEAGVRPPSRGGPADQLVARSVEGMTLGSPVETVMDGRDALLAVGMNGEPLPFDHGFPVRMLVPGLYGYVSACKWLRELELTSFDDFDAYWVRRDWAREAPIKTQSRIDTPRPFASPKAGEVTVAGVAWAQHRGIARVELRVDGGPWQDAQLATETSRDTWRQWRWQWRAAAGSHTLEVRATDREGDTQTERRVGTVPDGATGLHSVVVSVT
ncbi:molybdopterin-dependent oxidoreductase [Streptomyces sp. NPDC058657]|uniref:molybdopterin-dependent oxidoreductase n=1 Tax=unclassified Streptomyces TaxID=2593676 RepID=UPI00364A74CD